MLLFVLSNDSGIVHDSTFQTRHDKICVFNMRKTKVVKTVCTLIIDGDCSETWRLKVKVDQEPVVSLVASTYIIAM